MFTFCVHEKEAVSPFKKSCDVTPRVGMREDSLKQMFLFLTKSCSNLAIIKVHWRMGISNKILSALCRVVSALVPFTTELGFMLRGMMSARKHHMLKMPWHWHQNDHDGISNHQPCGCLLNLLFRRRWKKTWKLRITGLCAGNSPKPVNSQHKGPVTRKMFPFDGVIMAVVLPSWEFFWGVFCRNGGHVTSED